MRMRFIFLCALIGVSGLTVAAQANGVRANSSVVGVWRANADGMPFVALNITNEGEGLSGAVLFYLHRGEPGQAVTSSAGVPEPLIDVTFDGETLAFKVSHRRAHPPASLPDPAVSFQLKLTGPDKGTLIRENDTSATIELTRSDY